MKTIELKLFNFEELSDKAQKKALEDHRYIETDYDWWEFTYEDFKQFCEEIGVKVEKINFQLSYSQGDGAAIKASIDLPRLLKTVKEQTWKKNYPNEKIEFYPVTHDMERVCKLIQSGAIDGSAWIEQGNRGTTTYLVEEYGLNQSGLCYNPIRVIGALNELIEFLKDVTKTLERKLFQDLKNELEFRMKDETIIECFNSNQYTFEENGTMRNA